MSRKLILLSTPLVALLAPANAIAGSVSVAASSAYGAGRIVGVAVVIVLVILLLRRFLSGRKRP
jgi:nitrate reductase gamma subunit